MSFAPGHVSLTFAIHNHNDPIKMGSTGLGIVLHRCADIICDTCAWTPNNVQLEWPSEAGLPKFWGHLWG